MLLLVTILTMASLALGTLVPGLVVTDLKGPFESGGELTLDWTSNGVTGPTAFNLVLYSATFNSRNPIAENVNIFANQIAVQLPTLPPADDYIFWFEDLADATDVYANSNVFTVTAPPTTAPPTTTPVVTPASPASTPPKGTTSTVTTTVAHPSTPTTASSRGFTTSSRSPTASSSPSSSSHPASPPIGGSSDAATYPPMTLQLTSASTLASTSTTQAFQTQSAIQLSKKPMSTGSIAGIVIGVVLVLLIGVLIWLGVRRSREMGGRDADLEPQIYVSPVHASSPEPAPWEAREKSGGGIRIPQEALVAQLRTMQEQLAISSGGTADADLQRQNEVFRARIAALEQELESQTSGTSYESPPGYSD
ncbi:hypothetical protein DFH06DRAFT_363091 [Mycena polygramma]|nr:hypothetical protein DFH06DRAFT_363091 [Mycena polygramma]